MKSTQLCAVAVLLGCAVAQSGAAEPAGGAAGTPGPWRSLLGDHDAPAWRGWKEPGLPAGWRVAGAPIKGIA